MDPRLIREQMVGPRYRAGAPRLCDYAKSSNRDEVESVLGIDVRRWQRGGFLCPGTMFLSHWLIQPVAIASLLVRVNSSDAVQLSYRIRARERRWGRIDLTVPLVWASCNYGGRRVWFCCPEPDCHRRVAVLHLGRRNRTRFGCRRCAGLRYGSEVGGPQRRLIQKAQKIRQKLGRSESLLEPFPAKPGHMRWDRYERLRQKAEEAELGAQITPTAACPSEANGPGH
jgi:hypothetical protein